MKLLNIAIADDHKLVREGIASLITKLGHRVVHQSDHGKMLLENLEMQLPDLVLMDLQMPVMNGWDATAHVAARYPALKILVLTMNDVDEAVLRAIRAGAHGYLLKDTTPAEMALAIEEVTNKGFYHSDFVSRHLANAVYLDGRKPETSFSERELTFLKFVCSELTYKEIASEMCLSPRTIDGYRDDLFDKLHTKSRVGLALYAIKNGLVTL